MTSMEFTQRVEQLIFPGSLPWPVQNVIRASNDAHRPSNEQRSAKFSGGVSSIQGSVFRRWRTGWFVWSMRFQRWVGLPCGR